jgi:CDP-glucose 4,6-dehydratase
MAKTVITGGQGFLGRNLTDRLVDRGEDVCSTYSYTLPPRELQPANCSYFKLDVTKFEDCLKLVNQESPKIIYHFVAQPLVTAAQRHPFSTFELTVRGAYNLLEAVRQAGTDTKVIVYTTDKVYGENGDAKEGDRLDTVSNPYEVAKVCEDLIARTYARSFDVPLAIVRSANIYGRYETHWDRIVPYVCREVVHGRHPYLRSNGLQYRDYIYVDDIMDGILMVGEMLLAGDIEKGTAINFGANKPYNAFEMVEMILEISDKNYLNPVVLNSAKGEISYQHINFDYAKSLGWTPKTDIMDGLRKTYQWYREWFS